MDIPKTFNVSMLRDSKNEKAVFSSKAIGEPPLCLAVSVFFAIREAIKAAQGPDKSYIVHLTSPATAEKIRMACQDDIVEKVRVENVYFISFLTRILISR